jgi:hypothetical protein
MERKTVSCETNRRLGKGTERYTASGKTGKMLSVTGFHQNCQTQEKIGNYSSLPAYKKAKV